MNFAYNVNDSVSLVDANACAPRLKPGSVGRVVARRGIEGRPQYLVKFVGYGSPIHCEETELLAGESR